MRMEFVFNRLNKKKTIRLTFVSLRKMYKLDKNVKRKRSVILRISFWGHAEGFLKPCGVEVFKTFCGTIKKHLNFLHL